MSQEQEQDRVAKIGAQSRYAQGANGWTTAYSFQILRRFIEPGPILEMGPAEGVMTEHLANLGHPLTVVEGSPNFCAELTAKYPQASVIHSLFEDFKPTQKFRTVVLGHVLEHIVDPGALLKQIAGWLVPGGRVLSTVPNSRSLHRQVGVMMNLLKFEEELNEADHHHGHRRVYNPETFRREFTSSGFDIEFFGGYFLKPLANAQIEKYWSAELVDAFMKLGERYPDIAGELVVIARAK